MLKVKKLKEQILSKSFWAVIVLNSNTIFFVTAIFFCIEILIMIVTSTLCWILLRNFKFEVGDQIERFLIQVLDCEINLMNWKLAYVTWTENQT